jgi:hypothetical protein
MSDEDSEWEAERIVQHLHNTARHSGLHRSKTSEHKMPTRSRTKKSSKYRRTRSERFELNPDSTVSGIGNKDGTREQKKVDPRTRQIECVVCSELMVISELPYLVKCAHEPQTCRDCFAAWIKSELDKKGWQGIKCPGSDCRVILAHNEVQEYAAKEVFDQYDLFAMRATLGNDPNFRWCRAPGCASGQVHLNGEDGNIFRCVACGHRVCVVHNDTFHEGETCQEFDYRTSGRKERDQRRQEEASEQAVRKSSKVCTLLCLHYRTV